MEYDPLRRLCVFEVASFPGLWVDFLGLGVLFAAAKFLCYSKKPPDRKAFMRIYLQIPVSGTQYQSPLGRWEAGLLWHSRMLS